MCPICILTAMVFGPGLVTACGINWLGAKRRKNGEAECAGALTLGLSGDASTSSTEETTQQHAA